MVTLYTHNNKLVKINNKFVEKYVAPPPPDEVTIGPDEVTIGNQTWMAKNLAIDDGQGGITTRTVNYGQGDVVEYYYTWDAALRVSESINGWHLPSSNEWSTLITAVGSNPGTKLKSTYAWENNENGTDDYGFSALPAGYWNNGFSAFKEIALFWTATESQYYAEFIEMIYYSSVLYSNRDRMTMGYSIRLVKD